ncbi:serine hydrolase domain-containing protein [Kaarinaea lacus]
MEAEQYILMRDELSKEITRGMKKHHVMGMSIALQDSGEIVWAEGFGYADKKQKRKATAQTLYKAGSISKVFTATAVMQLTEQGLVDIDSPIQTYIPELKPIYHVHVTVDTPITLRQIMTHRSGLSGDQIAGMFTEHPKRFDTVIDYINSVHAPYAPGTVAAYSNIATDLQGVVVERISGERFEDFIEKHILAPLNMNESTFDDEKVNQILMSRGYKRYRENKEYPIRNLPAGNLHTNVIELSNFAKMILANGNYLLRPETTLEMLSEQENKNGLYDMGMKFGLNWALGKAKLDYLGKVVWHDGGTINFMSKLLILPDQGLSVAVLSNTAMSLPFVEEIAERIAVKAAEVKSGVKPPRQPEPAVESPFTEELVKQMPGTYATMVGPIKIYADGSTLKARVLFFKALLRHHVDGWLTARLRLFGFIPLPLKLVKRIRVKMLIKDTKELLIAEYDGDPMLAGIKVTPAPIPTVWKSYVGKYTLDLPEGDFSWFKSVQLDIKEGFLMAFVKIENQGGGALILKPISDEMAVIEGIGRGMQETIYVSQRNGKPVLNYGGYCLVKN